MVRVLHLIASSRGGGAAHVRDLALRLDPARFQVQVAMPEDGGHVRREDFETAGIPFHRVGIAAGFSLRALNQIRRLAARVRVFHVHGGRAAFFGRAAAASLGRRRPRVVYTIHGFSAPYYRQPRRALLLAVERALAPFTDRFVAVCQAEGEALVAAGVARPEKMRVVRNGIDVARFHDFGTDQARQRAALGIPPDALLITTICRLDKPRDFDTLLAAFRLVADSCSSAHLLIVGDGPLRPQVEQRIGALFLGQQITLAGWRNDLAAISAASDIYVLTTWGWEGLPLTVLEAMASGLPVVATRAGGIPEVVVDGKTGLLVDRRDVRGLADALKRLAHDPHLRQQMAEAGKERVQEEFTRERMVNEIGHTYELLLRGPLLRGGCG